MAPTLLVGCSAASQVTSTPTAPPDLGPRAWEVSGGGEFVTGVAILCPAETTILIEDEKALTDPDADLVGTMTFLEGTLTYSTSWYTSSVEPPLGAIDGSGTYVIELDDDGQPVKLSADGVVEVLAEDGSASEHPDHVELTFTAIATPEYCA